MSDLTLSILCVIGALVGFVIGAVVTNKIINSPR